LPCAALLRAAADTDVDVREKAIGALRALCGSAEANVLMLAAGAQSSLGLVLAAEEEALVVGEGNAELAKELRQLLSEMDA